MRGDRPIVRYFVLFFVLTFSFIVLACMVNGQAWDRPEWLVGECVFVSAASAWLMSRYGSLLFPASEQIEFDFAEDEEDLINE